jgi:hypothetical protein
MKLQWAWVKVERPDQVIVANDPTFPTPTAVVPDELAARRLAKRELERAPLYREQRKEE